MENIQKFYDKLAGDAAMQERAKALGEKYKGEKPDEAAINADIIAFAKAEGFSITMEDLNEYAKKAKPVTDEQLDVAAGGTAGCGCAGIGGGGGTDHGKTFACACEIIGVGASEAGGGVCSCTFAGVGGAEWLSD